MQTAPRLTDEWLVLSSRISLSAESSTFDMLELLRSPMLKRVVKLARGKAVNDLFPQPEETLGRRSSPGPVDPLADPPANVEQHQGDMMLGPFCQ